MLWVTSSAMSSTRNCGKYISISAGASEPGASWNTISTPSMVRVSYGPARSTPVGRDQRDRAAATVLPRPVSTWPRGPGGSSAPNWYCARRLIAVPAMMFSRDRVLHEAVRREHLHLAGRDVGLADHALDAAKVVGVAVRIDHRADRLLRPVLIVQIERGARRLGRQQRIDRGSAPVSPSMIVMLEMSKPRT